MKGKLAKIVVTLTVMAAGAMQAFACTSAIVSAAASKSGRPMLWKHRDTGEVDNKVEYIAPKDGAMGYVALFNASDRQCREAWTGMNEVGFAVMNTASYNLNKDDVPQRLMDREGEVMSRALATCRTVDDFAALLDKLPRPMGVEANFGVIDANGDGAYFETGNYGYTRYNLSDAPDGIMVRTNYSHSGRKDEGLGYIREADALHLIAPYRGKNELTPEVFTEEFSRSFYHDVYGKDMAAESGERWLIDQDYIPRYKSSATIVIEGIRPGSGADPKSEYIMWTGLGYSPCAEVYPVWCRKDGVDPGLRGLEDDGHARLSDEAKARRGEVFPIHRGNGDRYIDMTKLFNAGGTGYVQTLTRQNRGMYERVKRLRDAKR